MDPFIVHLNRSSKKKKQENISAWAASIEELKSSENLDKAVNKIRVHCMISYVFGSFPVENFLFCGRNPMAAKKISLAFLYSVFIFIFKLYVTSLLNSFSEYANVCLQITQNGMDSLLESVMYMSTYLFGVLAHPVAIWSVGKFLLIISEVEKYDVEFNEVVPKGKVLILSMFGISYSLVVAACPTVLTYSAISFAQNRKTSCYDFILELFAVQVRDIKTIIVVLFLAILWIEWSSQMLYFMIMYPSSLLEKRAEKLLIRFNTAEQWTSSEWEQFSRQFLSYHKLFRLLSPFVGARVMLLYSSLIVATISMIYLNFTGVQGVALSSPVFLAIESFNAIRICTLASIGDIYVNFKSQLLNKLNEISVEYSGMSNAICPNCNRRTATIRTEKLKSLIAVVERSSFFINAFGIFTVSRKNLSSIFSTVITYIIVMMQFRISVT